MITTMMATMNNDDDDDDVLCFVWIGWPSHCVAPGIFHFSQQHGDHSTARTGWSEMEEVKVSPAAVGVEGIEGEREMRDTEREQWARDLTI